MPTLASLGVAIDVESWYALFAPAPLDAEARHGLASAWAGLRASAEFRQMLSAHWLRADASDRDDFTRRWRLDERRWRQLAHEAGVTS